MTCGFASCPRSWHPIKLTKQAKFSLPAGTRRFMHCVTKMGLFLYFSCQPNDFSLPQQRLSVAVQLVVGTKATCAAPWLPASVRRWVPAG